MKLCLALAIGVCIISFGESAFRGHRSLYSDLSHAVEGGDVASVERITALLLKEARKKAPRQGLTINAVPKKATDAEVAVKSAVKESLPVVQAAQTQAPQSCLLDDQLFALTPESKKELKAELQDATMVEAVNWTKTGGWWMCGYHGELCHCNGSVRLVDEWHTVWSTPINARTWGGKTWCDKKAFGKIDVKPGVRTMCECAHAADGSDFHLHKRLTSKGHLQEMWIFLLRLLGRTRLMPTGTGDRLYHGIENWGARHIPGNMPLVIERIWIDMFMQKVVIPQAPGPRCLEWGNPVTPGKGFNYANMVPQCTDKFDMQYDAIFFGQKTMGVEGNVVYSDIDQLPAVLTTGHDLRMNLIFATQVFEHIANPQHAAQMLFHSLMPGGAIVFTAPQQAQFHLVPHDYFRYTKEGAVHLLQQVGFCVPKTTVTAGGDFVFDIARDAGLQIQDFPNEELAGAYQSGYDQVSHSAITIQILAFKQPHPSCASAMPAILAPR